MTLILDSGAITALAGQRARLAELRRRGLWPAQVPAVVLVEALTGDHRCDFHTNRLLRTCQVRGVTEPLARAAAQLRTASSRASAISAADAIVAAYAATCPEPIVITNDRAELTALAAHASRRIKVAPA
jgi:hypothetical protein